MSKRSNVHKMFQYIIKFFIIHQKTFLNVPLRCCGARVLACLLKSLSGYTHPIFKCVTLNIFNHFGCNLHFGILLVLCTSALKF